MNFVLSDLDAVTGTPEAILLDDLIVPPFTEAVSALFFWRFEDEPTAKFQYLGSVRAGFPFTVPFDGSGREIRISMIGRGANGVQSAYDPREGVQTTFTPPAILDTILTLDGDLLTLDGEILTLES